MPLSAYEMKIKSGWQLLGAVEPINMMSIFQNRCVNSIFTYKNNEWIEYKFNYTPSTSGNDLADRGIKKGDGFWVNGLSDDNCSVNLYEEIEPILVGRTSFLETFSYTGKNIITSQETFQTIIDELNSSIQGVYKGTLTEKVVMKWTSILEKKNINFEKNNIFLNVMHEGSICDYHIDINFEDNIYGINANYLYRYRTDSISGTTYKSIICLDTIVSYLMVFRISKKIKTFDVKSFRDEKITIENK